MRSFFSFFLFLTLIYSVYILFFLFVTGGFSFLTSHQNDHIHIQREFGNNDRFASISSSHDVILSIEAQFRYFQTLLLLQSQQKIPFDLLYSILSPNCSSIISNNYSAVQINIESSFVYFQPKDPELQKKRPIFIAAHMDSTRYSSKDYDSYVFIEAIFKTIELIIKKNMVIDRTIIFGFIGSENYGSLGARYMAAYSVKRAFYLTLSGFGTGRPFTVLTKGKESSNSLNSLLKVKGVIVNTALDELRNVHSSHSFTKFFDDQEGLHGIGCSFIGNPSYHRTPYDKINNNNYDSLYVARILFNFIKNFHEDEKEYNLAAFGISPIIIKMDMSLLKYVSHAIVVLGFGFILFQTFYKDSSYPYFHFSKIFILSTLHVLFVYCAFACLVTYINPGSYVSWHLTFTFLFVIAISLMLFNCLKNYNTFGQRKDWALTQFTFYLILMAVFRNSQLSLCFLASTILSGILFFLTNYQTSHKILSIINLSILFPIFLLFSASYYPLSIFCLSVPHLLSDVFLLLSLFLFSMAIFISSMILCFPISSISFSKEKEIYEKLAFLPYYILIFFIVKPAPYSTNILLQTIFTQTYCKDSSQTQLFVTPVAGYKAMKIMHSSLTKMSNFTLEYTSSSYDKRFQRNEPSLVQIYNQTSLPSFFPEWPKIIILPKKNNNSTHTYFHIHISDIPPSIKMIELRFSSSEPDHIIEALVKHPPNFKQDNLYITLIRLNSFLDPVQFTFESKESETGEKVKMEVIYCSFTETEEMMRLRNSFTPFVQPFQEDLNLQGTIFIDNRLLV